MWDKRKRGEMNSHCGIKESGQLKICKQCQGYDYCKHIEKNKRGKK
jgi:hypothetical protein